MPRIKMLSPITILMIVVVIAAITTWLIPAGKYNTITFDSGRFIYATQNGDTTYPAAQSTLDQFNISIPIKSFQEGSIRKPVAVPGTFHTLPSNSQGIIDVLMAPVKGIIDSIDIILFLFLIGAFMNVFHETGALVSGLTALSLKMKGRESLLIVILTFLFSFGGASFGMAEETLAFYPVIVPLFIAAGYDAILPVAVLLGGTQLGTLSSFTNPFATIIASNAAGINWTEGLIERIALFCITTFVTILYFVWYAKRVKRNPAKSYQPAGIEIPFIEKTVHRNEPLSSKNKALLILFLFTFLIMIGGVVFLDWWLPEMSTLFLAASIVMAVITRTPERNFIDHFIKGAEGMLGVTLIVGVARGVTIILNEGNISDSILYYASEGVKGLPPSLLIVALFVIYIFLTLFISSSSGMAVLTMPIIGSLGVMADIPTREVVNSYLFGMGIMGFVTPTGLMLPSLAMVNVTIKAWWRFIYPLMIMLAILCLLFLLVGIHFK